MKRAVITGTTGKGPALTFKGLQGFMESSGGPVGDLNANRADIGKFFCDNLMMGVQLMRHGHRSSVEKFFCLGTIRAHPNYTRFHQRRQSLERLSGGKGRALRSFQEMLVERSQAYRDQYGFNSGFLCQSISTGRQTMSIRGPRMR